MSATKQAHEAQTVYVVRVVKPNLWWFPVPFARRESAHAWAQAGGYVEGDYEVEGFRVRE